MTSSERTPILSSGFASPQPRKSLLDSSIDRFVEPPTPLPVDSEWDYDEDGNPLLPWWRKVGYGIGDVAGGVIGTSVGFYYNFFLLNVAGVEPMYAGVALLLGRIFEAFCDPLIGILSDRTTSSLGRRRPWLLFGAPLLSVAFILLWYVPPFTGQMEKFIYFLVVQLFFSAAFTSVNLPYCSMTAEMSESYDDRTSLTLHRFTCSVLASAVAALVEGELLVACGYRRGFMVGAIVWAVVALGAVQVTFFTSKELRLDRVRMQKPISVLEGLEVMWKNQAFVCVAGVHALSWVSLLLVQNNLILFSKVVIQADDYLNAILACVMLTIIVSLIAFAKLCHIYGKKAVYLVGMVVWSAALMGFTFLEPEDVALFFFLAITSGIGIAAGALVCNSMLPDTIDLDEHETHTRREGMFYAVFTFIQKAGIAVALAVSNFALHLAGFHSMEAASEGAEAMNMQLPAQPESVSVVLRVLIGPLPAFLLLLSCALMYTYPVTRETHEALAADLKRRNHARRA